MTAAVALTLPARAEALQLSELKPSDVRIGPDDRDFLMREHRTHIDLRPRDSRHQIWTLTPGPWCGVIPLPSGRAVYVEPKVGIENLWRLLAFAWDLPKFPPDMDAMHSTVDLLEALVEVFVRRVEALLTRGLLRGYDPRRENLYAMRGRLSVAEHLRANAVAKHRLVCDFDEFTTDLPENRILRRALFLTLRAHSWRPRVRQRLDRCERHMAEVSLEHITRRHFDTLVFTRLNEHYRTPLTLARMLLEMLSVTHRAGEREMLPLLIEMPRLFERFLQRLLEERLPGAGLSVRWGHERRHLDLDQTVTLEPDMVICRHGSPVCIGDAKYKPTGWDEAQQSEEDARASRNADVYQMFAYCTGYGVRDAVLIYPQPSGRETIRIDTGSGLKRVHSLGIDLTGGGAEFEAACERLADMVAAVADQQRRPKNESVSAQSGWG
jgi:5-methylcytosine-specific restriction enzyme subunit McrC